MDTPIKPSQPLTLQECKDQIAKEDGYPNFEEYAIALNENPEWSDARGHVDRIANLYATQQNEALQAEIERLNSSHSESVNMLYDQIQSIESEKEALQKRVQELEEAVKELEDTIGLKYSGESNWDKTDQGDLTEYHGEPDEE
jgi:chromosome segregation ATPase